MTLLGRSTYATLKWQEGAYPSAAWLPAPPPSAVRFLLPSSCGKCERHRR
jgi:hypothetical protein